MEAEADAYFRETYTADAGITYSGLGKGANQAVQCASSWESDTIMVGEGWEGIPLATALVEKLKGLWCGLFLHRQEQQPTDYWAWFMPWRDGTVYTSIITGTNFDITSRRNRRLDWDGLSGTAGCLFSKARIPTEVVEDISSGRPNSIMYTLCLTRCTGQGKWTWSASRWQTA